MDAATIDQVQLNFNPQGLMIINIAIGFMMLGVALDIKLEDFKRILVSPKAPIIGLLSQFLLLPAFTFLLILVINPAPSIALGMILVAACPGGNLSNIITSLAKGNTAISVTMTAISSASAIIMTPLNLSIWGNLNSSTSSILKKVSLSPVDVFIAIFVILGIPVIMGIIIGKYFPKIADRIRKPLKIFSLVFFIVIVAGALSLNWKYFIDYVGYVVFAVALHNALALGTGYGAAKLAGLAERDRRAVSIEVGIQNSALGLVLVFNFFDGLGGMAILVAWWGIWHIISGLTISFFFSRKKIDEEIEATT